LLSQNLNDLKKAFVRDESMVQKVTLIGERQARIGFRFLFEGVADICSRCEVKNVCLGNLEPGRLYEVNKVLRKRFPCLLHSEDAIVVQVEEPPLETAVQARIAVNEALVTYSKNDCRNISCEYRKKCFPLGLAEGDRCKVVKVEGLLPCPLREQLLLVLLQRQSKAS
jgi:uncharacterized protein (UPF0179 family)